MQENFHYKDSQKNNKVNHDKYKLILLVHMKYLDILIKNVHQTDNYQLNHIQELMAIEHQKF